MSARHIFDAVTFEVAADAYDTFMGRYAAPLAVQFADLAEVQPGLRALDVGCGPGALTTELVRRLGADAVSAVDPSASFVAAIQARLPDVHVEAGVAEQLPFPDDSFDVALAQLVVHFMSDPVAGLREMGRVTRPGGRVAACAWDQAGGGGPISTFYRALQDVDPQARNEDELPGVREGHLVELSQAAGLTHVEPSVLTVTVRYETFDEWWHPYTLGVGPAGAYVAQLDEERREALRKRCAELSPRAPFDVVASAWAIRARA